MELLLDRLWKMATKTLAILYRNGRFECFSLEEVVRALDAPKVDGKTAIPPGRYRIVLVNSPKFGRDTPSLENVPGFSFIRIHAGTDEDDTEGCILVGNSLTPDFTLRNSRIARDRLKMAMKTGIAKGEEIWITVRNSPNPAAGG